MKGDDVTVESTVEKVSRTNEPGRGDRKTAFGRSGWLATLVAAAAIGLAACGGPSSPRVASLGTSTSLGNTSGNPGGSPTTTLPKGNPTTLPKTSSGNGSGNSPTTLAKDPAELLDEWAACMRSHGDPNQGDPSIDVHKVISIPWDPAIPGGFNGTNKGGQGNSGPGQYCRAYLGAAQTALQGGQRPAPSSAQLVEFSHCMRAHGFPQFPDPTASGLQINMGDPTMNPRNPTFLNASNVCGKKTGVQGFGGGPHPGMIELTNQPLPA